MSSAVAASPMKCFCVVVRHDISEVYVFAETAGKARWIAFRGYRDAGYDAGRRMDWSQVRSSRRPEYDRHWQEKFKNRYLSHSQMLGLE